jgi:hypothetical protein
MHQFLVLSLTLCVFTAAAQNASPPQFTARELFYSAASEPAKPTAPAPKPVVAVKKPPVQTPPTQSTAVPTPSQPAQPVTRSDGAVVIKASLVTAPAPATGTPLGLKYTILKKSGDEMVEVPPDTVFHAGDRIQLSVQTNGPGYLYIILRGSSGTWRPMFPSPDVADGDNHVDGWNAKILPPKSRMVFDEQTGAEHIFVVFSRTPEDGLENMIYSLQDGAKGKPAAAKEPDKAKSKKYVMSASADIPDSAVGHLRDTYTRDLVIEKVDEKTPEDKSAANKKENAVYVVNPSGSSDSRVVAEVTLVHQ